MKIELHPPSKNYFVKMKITSKNFTVSEFSDSSPLSPLTLNCCCFKFKFKMRNIQPDQTSKNYWARRRKKVTL